MKNFRRHMATLMLYFFCMVTVLGNFNISVSATEKSTSIPLDAVGGQLVIKLRDTKNKDYEKIIKKYNGKVIKYFGNYVLASFEKEDVKSVKTEVVTDKNVEYSEENALGKKSTTTIDPLAKTQDYLFYSRAMDGWDLVTDQMKQTTIKVAVVDSGVKSDHPDLKGSVDPGMNYVGGSTDTTDDNGHGTQVAGVIAAKHNNIGINGIAGLINTRIIPVKVLDANGVGTTANIAQGIMYAANSGAQIINVSINGKGYSKLIDDAVQYAIGKGAIVVTSSGDDRSYSENYWPCNASGTIVAASSPYDSNTGKNIDVFALGAGNTTDIGSTGYKMAFGSSISAAITSGAVALIKAKNPTYTLDQVRNILRKSNVNTQDNTYLSLKSALESQSDFITITSPVISQNTTGDVAGKITALNPSQLKQLSLFINDSATAYKVIQGNGSKAYDINIPFTELADGVNRLKAVATDSTGKTYVDERYFKSFGDNSTISITVKDLNGNLAKNMLVLLYEGGNGNNPKEVSTNSNGQAIFYNASAYSQYTAVVKNGDADNSGSKVIFEKQGVTVGKSIIDLSSESREITVNAYKADNTTMLSSANLSLDDLGDTDIALNKGSSTKIIVNKSIGLNMKVLSEAEGYYYEKAIDNFENLNTVNFLKDSNTAKLEINNIYDQQITDERITVNNKNGVYTGEPLGSFNIKGKALYIPKGNYSYVYSFSSNTSGSTSMYQPEDINLSSDSTISYGEPKVNVERGLGDFNLCMNLIDANHSFVLQDIDSSKVIINLKDPNGKSLVNGTDFTYANALYYEGEGFSIKVNNPISGNYQASATINYMGKTFASNVISLSFTGTQPSTNTTIKYTLPTELQSLVASQGYYTLDVRYYVYNASTGAMVYNQGELEDGSSINYGEISIPTAYCNNSYRIIISASAEYDKGVIYDRSLGTALNGVIKIDPATYTKKISFTGNNLEQYIKNSNVKITKIMPNNKNMNIQMKVSGTASLGIWLDDGKYSSLFNTSKSLIRSEFNVSSSNSIDNIDTTNLSNIKFTVPQNSYSKGIYIYPKIVDSDLTERFEVDYNNNYQVSPGTIINSFELGIADLASLRNKSYYFSGQLQCNALAQNNIDLSKCNVQYTNTPLSINKNDSLNFKSKVTAGAFTLSSFYSGYNWKGTNDSFNNYSDTSIGINVYNSDNKFLMWNPFYMSGYDASNGFSTNVYLSNLYGGDFKIKLDLEGLNLIDNGFSIKVIGDDMKIKVMDPFDITKPLSSGTVSLDGYGNDYKTTKDGYVYIPKSNLQDNSNVTVKAESDKGIVVFRSSVDISGTETTISTPITLLKNIVVKPLDTINGINLANSELRVNAIGHNYYKLGLLDNAGQANLYTNFDISKVFVQNSTSFLNVTYSGQGDAVIDNKNIGKLNVSLLSNKYLNITVDNSSNFSIQASGNYNISTGSYSYNYYDSNINYSGNFSISSGEIKNLKFGSTLSLTTEYHSYDGTTSSNVVKPGQNLEMNVNFKDEFGNIAYINSPGNLTYIVTVNGSEVSRGSLSSFAVVSFNPNVIADSFDVKFETTWNNQKYTSNSLNYKINLEGYQKIAVTDPSGNPLKTGEAKQYGNTFSISQGMMYVPKDTVLNGTISVTGTTTNGEYVVCPQVTVNSTLTSISLQGKKVNVATTFDNISEIVSGRLNITWDNSYYGGAININYNTDKNLVSNINVWLQDNVECYFDNYFYDRSNNQYALGKKFKNTSSSIQLSTNNMTEIKLGGTDNKNAGVMISQNRNGGGTGFSIGYNKLFISSDSYFVNGVNLYDGTSPYYQLRNDGYASGVSYTVFIGNNYKGNFSTDKLLKIGENMNIIGGTIDEYGNNVSFYSSENKEVQFINAAGSVVKTIKSQNGSALTVPTDITEGKYSLVISNYISDKKIASNTVDNVYVTNKSVLDLGYYGNKPVYKLYDGTTLVYFGSQTSTVRIPSSVLTDGKYYDLDILTQNYDGIGHYKRRHLFSNGQMQNDSVVNSVIIPLDSSVKKVKLTTSKGESIDYNTQDNYYNNTNAINLSLADGETYNISVYCEDSNGGYWASKTVKVDTTLKEIKFDRIASKKLSLASKFTNNVEVVGLTAKDLSSGKVYDINRGLNTNSSIYLPVGKYELNFKLNVNGTTTLNDYKKVVDLTAADYILTIGDKVTYDVLLDKSIYTQYDRVTAKVTNVKDGEIALAGIENMVIDSSTITMDLVHGTKVIKTFSNTISDTLKGDCNFIIKGNVTGLGNISSKVITLSINNSGSIKEGDINLDGIVDIFDIVYVAKDFGKIKGQSDYDPRVNLDASDTTIDAKDLARVAVNYER